MVTFNMYTSAEELTLDLSRKIVADLQQALVCKGHASLVVSGGKTPIELFKTLSQSELDWEKVLITLADERWVDENDSASNARLVRRYLLQNKASSATFVSLKTPQTDVLLGVEAVEQTLKSVVNVFDVVILGMGDDGHTASLFPQAENLLSAMDLNNERRCMAITPLTAPFDRLTLTLPALLNSQQIYLHLLGEKKHEVYQQAMLGDDWLSMPIRAVLQQNKTPVKVCWAP